MAVPSSSPDIPEFPTPLSALGVNGVVFPGPAITVGSDGGHATMFTTHLRLTIPTQSRRISPYVIAGAGVGSVTDTLRYTIVYAPVILTGLSGQSVTLPAFPSPQIESIARTTTDFAVASGGGVSFLTNDHWSFDVDARYIGILGERDVRLGRYGGGVTYRF
jgi:opacity protein-like surface antigen